LRDGNFSFFLGCCHLFVLWSNCTYLAYFWPKFICPRAPTAPDPRRRENSTEDAKRRTFTFKDNVDIRIGFCFKYKKLNFYFEIIIEVSNFHQLKDLNQDFSSTQFFVDQKRLKVSECNKVSERAKRFSWHTYMTFKFHALRSCISLISSIITIILASRDCLYRGGPSANNLDERHTQERAPWFVFIIQFGGLISDLSLWSYVFITFSSIWIAPRAAQGFFISKASCQTLPRTNKSCWHREQNVNSPPPMCLYYEKRAHAAHINYSCKVCLLELIGQSLPPVTTSIHTKLEIWQK